MNQVVKFISLFMLFVVVTFFIINKYHEWLNQSCYEKCSDFHIMGEASPWDYSDYLIVVSDTIWIDKECYDSWCICIDECNPGLCCEYLK